MVTKEQIRLRGYTSLAELLYDIPEIEVQQKNSTSMYGTITWRGVTGNNKFLIFLDGNRINSPAGSIHAVIHNYSVAHAEKVEVVLGPGSALYGVDTFIGVINIITQKGDNINGVNMRTGYGNFNTSNNSIVLGFGKKDFSFNINGSFIRSDEPPFQILFPDFYDWYNNQYSVNQLMPVSQNSNQLVNVGEYKKWDISERGYTFNANFQLKKFNFGLFKNMASHSSALADNPRYSIFSKENKIQTEITTLFGNHEYQFSPNLSFQSQFVYSKYETNPISRFQNVFSNYLPAYKYAFEKSFILNEDLKFKVNENSDLIFGVQYQAIAALPKTGDLPFKYDVNKPADLQGFYYLGTNILDSNGNNMDIQQDFYYTNYQNIGSYFQFRHNIKNIVKLTLGGRMDFNTRFGRSFSPRVGVLVNPHFRYKIKLLYGSAFLAAAPHATFEHFGSFVPVTNSNGDNIGFQSGFWQLPNPDLKPERMNTFELSQDFRFNKSFTMSANVFYNEITDLISGRVEENVLFKGVNVRRITKPTNRGLATIYGGTVKFNYIRKLSLFAQSGKINSSFAFSYLDGRTEGNILPFASKDLAKSQMDFLFKKLDVGFSFIYRFSQNNNSLAYTDDVFLMNLNAVYKVWQKEKNSFC